MWRNTFSGSSANRSGSKRNISHAASGTFDVGMGVGSPRGSGGSIRGRGGTGVTGVSRRGMARVGRSSMSSTSGFTDPTLRGAS